MNDWDEQEAMIGAEQLRKMTDRAKQMQSTGYSNSEIAEHMGISENYVQSLVGRDQIEWGYNCLTQGVHHGRPEKLWNLPLIQATFMFSGNDLQELVIYRIYTDALIYVYRGDEPRPSKEWAEKVKVLAEKKYPNVFQRKIGEIAEYYRSPQCTREQQRVIERLKDNRLNPHYEPLHGHDSINLLCRIIGTSAARDAADG